MVTMKKINDQLRKIGCDYAFWGRSEIRELTHILMDDEQLLMAVNGYYDGGFAMICATNYRVLIVDKKPFALNVEDLRYDMIAQVDYSARVFTSVLHVYTPMRTLVFTSWSMRRLYQCMNYIQQRVMELRNNDYLMNQFIQQSRVPAGTEAQGQGMWQRRSVPNMNATTAQMTQPTADFESYRPSAGSLVNPYTKIPLLSRRRKYPSLYGVR